MSYHNLLQQYGHEQPQAETRVYIFAQAPAKLSTPSEVAYRDADAARMIKRLESLVDDLKDYRQALAARYAELETLPYCYALKLERVPHWKGHIEYIITIKKALSDGTETDELREIYPGKERRAALSRYDELKRQRPGIPAEMDIAKRPWE